MATPLLVLHGAIGANDQLMPLIDQFSDKIDATALNFSGHGGSSLPGSFGIETFAHDVLQWMDSESIEAIDIFGYSMGGYVGLWLAKNHPERVKSVFTLATKMAWSPEVAAKETRMLNPEKIEEKVPAFAAALAKRHEPANWKQVLNATAQMMIDMGNRNPWTLEELKEIKCPVALALGDRDTMVTLEETIAVYRQLENARMLVFPLTPHPIEKVDVARLACEIETFLLD